MDITVITQLVGSLGFPIFACCAMGAYIYRVEERHVKVIEGLTTCMESVKDSVDVLTGGIRELTREVEDKMEENRND